MQRGLQNYIEASGCCPVHRQHRRVQLGAAGREGVLDVAED